MSQVTEDSARGGFFLFSGAALASVSLAISAILMGRLLGPELYGQYNLVLVIPTLLLLFTDLGINAGVTKFAASLRAEGKNERIPTIVRHGLLFRLGIGVLISVLSLVFAQYFALLINRADFTFLIQLASFSVIFQVVYSTSNSAFVGLDKSEYSALITTVRAILTTVLQIALVIFSFSVTGAIVGFVGGFVVSSALGAALLFIKFLKPSRKSPVDPTAQSSRQVLQLLTRYGLPVYVSVILIGFFPLYQQLVLAFFSSDAAIGNFRAAFNFVALLAVISTSITTALLPAFSKLESATSQVISAFFNRANKYTCLLIIPITVLVVVFSDPIVQLLYGSGFSSAPLYLSLSCSVYFLSIIGSFTLISVFNGVGKTRLTMNMTLINLALLLVLSPALAVPSGVVGVIGGSLLSTTAAAVYAAIVSVRQLGIKFDFKPTLRIVFVSVFSALLPLALLSVAKLNFVVVLFVGGAMYLGVFVTLMPLMKIVDSAEIEALKRVTRRLPFINFFAKLLFEYQSKILSSIMPQGNELANKK